VNRATLYGVTGCGPHGRAPGRTYAERVIRPVRDVPARPDLLLPALAQALSGAGPAVAPGPAGAATGDVPDDVALVVRTSGSTGEPPQAPRRSAAPATSTTTVGVADGRAGR